MNEDTIADLKQFISAAIYQQTGEIRGDISGIKDDIVGIKDDIVGIKDDIVGIKDDISSLKTDIKKLDHKIDDLSEFVGDALANSNEATDKQLKNHEKRITKLEHKPA